MHGRSCDGFERISYIDEGEVLAQALLVEDADVVLADLGQLREQFNHKGWRHIVHCRAQEEEPILSHANVVDAIDLRTGSRI